jgi:GNAT superfamily N-acetyltransferase
VFKIREAKVEDIPYIYDSFLMSFKGSPGVEHMASEDYFPAMRATFTKLLEDAVVEVACAEDDPETILGWAAYHDHTLLYVAVKKAVRGHGIAKALVPPFIREYAFHSKQVRKVPEGWKHRPDRVWMGLRSD